MKKFRKRLLEMKEGNLDAKFEKARDSFIFANIVFISIVAMAITYASMIFIVFNLKYISYIIATITLLAFFFFQLHPKAFMKVMPFSARILLNVFGRYGRVVTKEDWKNIKKYCPMLYKKVWKKDSLGHCYFYSWAIALYLKNAEIMYCSIDTKDGATGHAVIVKNNCVYDTNRRQHYDLEEYKELFGVNIYKLFSEKEYREEKFFDNIREGFVNWCAENNVYCDPQ